MFGADPLDVTADTATVLTSGSTVEPAVMLGWSVKTLVETKRLPWLNVTAPACAIGAATSAACAASAVTAVTAATHRETRATTAFRAMGRFPFSHTDDERRDARDVI